MKHTAAITALWLAAALAGALHAAEPLHWSFQPLTRPYVSVDGASTRAHSPIDTFIWQRLRQESVEPSPEAARRTLIRRVTLDLVGLPPT